MGTVCAAWVDAGPWRSSEGLEDGVLARVQPMGVLLGEALRRTFGEHPHVGEIRGRGLLWALKLVRDRATKQPFDASIRLHARVKRAALQAGLTISFPLHRSSSSRLRSKSWQPSSQRRLPKH